MTAVVATIVSTVEVSVMVVSANATLTLCASFTSVSETVIAVEVLCVPSEAVIIKL